MDYLLDLPQVVFTLGVLRFLIMLSVLIFVHELGHFAVAKWCGIYVATFSIGMGRRLFGFKRGETDYRLSAVPIGGYVKMIGQSDMPQDANEPVDEDELACPDHMRFDAKPVWQRVAVSFAGPAMSLAFGIVVYWAMFVTGVPMPRGFAETKIGYVVPGGPAAEAGIRPGDRVLSIDGYRPKDWEHLKLAIVGVGENTVEMELADEHGQVRTVRVRPQVSEGESLATIGIQYYEEFIVEAAFEGQPAATAGMQAGDIIIGLRDPDGVEHPASALQTLVREHMGERITFVLRRGDEQLELAVAPGRTMALEGIEFDGITVLAAGGPAWADVDRRQIPRGGDELVAINGTVVSGDDSAILGAVLGDEVGISVPVQFRRGDRTWSVLLNTTARGIIGIRYSTDTELVKYGYLEAMPKSVERFVDTVKQTIATVGFLFRGSVGLGELAGPLRIGTMSEQAAQVGWAYYLYMVGLITINLGVVNLLPIPILDGGNIVVLLVEGVRRRPLSDRAMYYLQHVGLVFIVVLFVFVTFNDIRAILEGLFGGGLG